MPYAKNYLLFLLLAVIFIGCQGEKISGIPLKGEVKNFRGKPVIHINNGPEAPMLYALTDVPGGRWSWEEVPQHNIQQFCEQGIRLFQLDLFLEQVWLKNQKIDVSLARKQVQGVLDVCPNAAIFFRFHLNPPAWWMSQHPEESVVYDGALPKLDTLIGFSRILQADPRNPIRASMASSKWRDITNEKLRKFCRLFSKTPEGNALVGIQVAYGIYGEWHQWGLHQYEADFSAPMTVHFQNWSKLKYQKLEIIRKAWGDSSIIFSEVTVPDTKRRSEVSLGVFRDPIIDQKVIDYYKCQHELIAENIIEFCKTVKSSWPRPIITGAFYGYFFSVFNRQAAGGHLALQAILKSEYIDYLGGPQVYYPEEGNLPGEPYRSRCLNHSILLNEKLWLDEYDQEPRRTWPYISIHDNREAYQKILAENISMLRRSAAFPLLKGQGLWFYDFGPAGMHLNKRNQYNSQAGTSGYWDNPAYLDQIKQLKSFADQLLHEEYQSPADVLVIYDTESIFYLPSTKQLPCPITEQVINWSTLALHYSGCLFDQIHLDDLKKVDLDNYKVVVFMNTFLLNEGEKSYIKTTIANNDRQLVWIYAPGYLDGKKADINFISQVTGISLDTFHSNNVPEIIIDNEFVSQSSQKGKGKYSPIFYINDEKAENFGWYKHKKVSGLGSRQYEHYKTWYSGVPITDYRIFRKIFKQADVNLYAQGKDIVYGNNNYLLYHTVNKGKKNINYQGKTYQFDFQKAPATKFLNLQNGEIW